MQDISLDSILLVRLRAVGEVVMTLPVVDVVRRNLPNTHLAMLVEAPCDQIFAGDSRVNEVFVFDKPSLRSFPYPKRLKAFSKFVLSMRKRHFDMAIDLHNVSRSQWLTFLSGSRNRVGLKTRAMTCHLHTRILNLPEDSRQHNITRYMEILKSIGLDVSEYTYEMRLSEQAIGWAKSWLETGGVADQKHVVIHPGAAHRHKCWPPSQFARLGDLLYEHFHADVIVSCGPGETPLGEEVQQGMKSPARLACDMDLQQLGALLSLCDLTVSNDTGPTHISSAVGTPTLAVIGPTNPYKGGPATTCSEVVWAERYCSPCYRHMFTCPLRKCFSMVTPERAFDRATAMLEQGRPERIHSSVPGVHRRKDLQRVPVP